MVFIRKNILCIFLVLFFFLLGVGLGANYAINEINLLISDSVKRA